MIIHSKRKKMLGELPSYNPEFTVEPLRARIDQYAQTNFGNLPQDIRETVTGFVVQAIMFPVEDLQNKATQIDALAAKNPFMQDLQEAKGTIALRVSIFKTRFERIARA